MDKDLFNPTDSAASVGVKPIKKAQVKAVKHATATGPPLSTGFPKPGDAYWKQHPLITEHKDGTVRQWGEDTTAHNPNLLPKQMLPPEPKKSEKAMGYASNYYPPNH